MSAPRSNPDPWRNEPMSFEQMGVVVDAARDRLILLERLARDLYSAISDVYEDVEKCVDADLVGDAYRSNWAGNAIERWKPLLERAERVLGLAKQEGKT